MTLAELGTVADRLSERTGLGLARSWGLIHSGDYGAARRSLDEVAAYSGLRVDWAHRSLAEIL